MTKFYEFELSVLEGPDPNSVARYFALAVAKRCRDDSLVLAGADLYDIVRSSADRDLHRLVTERHRLVVACLDAGERNPTEPSAVLRIISPMLLQVMRREVTAA